jgi:integrase
MATISKRGNRFVVDYYDAFGKRRRERKRTRKAAKDRLGEILKSNGQLIETRRTVKEYGEAWLETYGKTHLKDSTYQEYKAALEKHVFPIFGRLPFTKVSREAVKRLIAEKIAAGFSRSTVRNIIAPLREMYNHAIDDGAASFNPASRVGRFNRRRGEDTTVDPLTKEELHIFLKTVREQMPDYYPLFFCAVTTGMRQGELIGLKPIDVDFAGRFIHVQRNISRGEASSPKNGKTRRVDMSLQLTNLLDQLVAKRRATALTREMEKSPEERRKPEEVVATVMEDWLFTTPEIIAKRAKRKSPARKPRGGTRLDPSNLRKVFWSVLSKAELRRVRFHDLRHTFASLLIQQGESLAYVKDQLGHHSIQITVDTYGHLVPGGNRRAVDRLAEDVENAKPQESDSTGHQMVTRQLERRSDYV